MCLYNNYYKINLPTLNGRNNVLVQPLVFVPPLQLEHRSTSREKNTSIQELVSCVALFAEPCTYDLLVGSKTHQTLVQPLSSANINT